MSTPTRTRDEKGRFVPQSKPTPRPRFDLAANSAAVPGGLGVVLDEPVRYAEAWWTPSDGDPFGCPIGAALAAELAAGGAR